MNDLEQWKQDLENYYRNLFFMDPKHKDDWQEAARQAAELQYQAELLKRQTSVTLPEVTVTASNPTKTVAVESDWGSGYTKFMSGERYYADQEHKNYLDLQRNDMTNSIRETTNKWGNAIGAGVEIASGFTPLWWAAPAVRTGLNLSEGNYKGAALNAGLAFAAPYAVGKAFLYGDDLYRGYKSMTDPKNVYAAMAEEMAPVKTSSAGMWTNRGTRSAKISEAERLGIPKGERNAYLIGTNADPSYYAAIGLNNSHYTQRLRDFHFDLSFPRIERTTVHHGNMIPDNRMLLRGLSPYFDGGRLFGYFSSSSYPIAKTYNFVDGASTYSLYPIIKKPYVLQANGRNGIEVATNKYNLVVKTDQVVKQAFDAGHDGVIIKNVVDIGPVRANLKNASEVADDIITLPGKAKMADAVTYDDLYQIIPLSQRDNILIHDIRYKQGGSIKIKKKNRGKFTDYCGGKVTEECIRKGKNSSNPTTRKRANFAWVARHKFKHGEGGNINYLNIF